MTKHTCAEGEMPAVELNKYPRAVWYCGGCDREMRRQPLDDLPGEVLEGVLLMIKEARNGHNS